MGKSGEFFTFDEVLKRLAINENKLKRLVSEGEIRPFRSGDQMLFRETDVEGMDITGQIGDVSIDAPRPPAIPDFLDDEDCPPSSTSPSPPSQAVVEANPGKERLLLVIVFIAFISAVVGFAVWAAPDKKPARRSPAPIATEPK